MSESIRLNRRSLLKSGTAGLALTTGPMVIPAVHGAGASQEPPRVGLVGCGWYGKVDLLRLIQVAPVNVVSLCDVDRNLLEEAGTIVASRQASGEVPRRFTDYREMLREKDLDIVLIATPDHWHALNMIEAVKAGADVYVQKPTGVDVIESQAMLAAARKYERVVQVGTQRRSTPHLINAIEKVIKPGLLGTIGHVELCCYYHMRARQNPPDSSPPEHLDYEMWTGPAPMRPYNELVHPRRWRAFMEYSNGIVGDMCIHMLDTVRWMLDLGWPSRVSSIGGIFVDPNAKANTTDTQSVQFDFAEEGMSVCWQHRAWGHAVDSEYPWAAIIYGEKGTLKLSVNRYDFIPRGSGQPIHEDVVMELDEYPEDRDEKDLERHVAPAVRGHMKDFLAAIQSRGKPVADIEQGHISSTSCILANLALQLGRSLEWDPASHQVVDDEEANRLLARPYRDPWQHPDPATV